MKPFSKPRFVFVSPLLLAAATGLLLLIILTFAFSNMQREKHLMQGALLQKAGILMRVVLSGAKSSYLRDVQRGLWQPSPWTEHMQRVLEHVADDPETKYIAVVNSDGVVIADSKPSRIGSTIDFTRPEQKSDSHRHIHYQIKKNEEKQSVFEAVRLFTPYQPVFPPEDIPLLRQFRRNFERDFGMHPRNIPLQPKQNIQKGPYFLLVGLDMAQYDASLRRLYFQVGALSITMLLVGLGGWLSLSTLQGYRGTKKILREVQAFTALLVAKLPVGIITTDPDGKISTFNQAATTLLDISGTKAHGKSAKQILPEQLSDFLESSKSSKKELHLYTKKQDLNLLTQQLEIRDDAGLYKGKVLLLSDMTELKKMESQLREHERLAAVGRMAAGVAHEVRNPLSSIKGLAVLLKSKLLPGPEGEKNLHMLISEVDRVNRTVSELLTLTSPATLERETLDLESLIRNKLQLLQPDLTAAGIEASVTVDKQIPFIFGDRDRLGQVLLNVFLNSIQAMPEGGRIQVSLQPTQDTENVMITINDTGSGLDAEQQGQVFFPYFTTKSGGTGIGLAISQKIINDHGGTITFTAKPERGATVTIILPVQERGN